jgi:hypothetical protein
MINCAEIGSVMKNGAAKSERSKTGMMYFIALEGSGFLWFGKLKFWLKKFFSIF